MERNKHHKKIYMECSNIRIIGVPGGEEEEKEIENLFEQIMKENFPNLAKQIDFQEVQEAHRVSKKLNLRKHTPRHIIITLPRMKDKERILKAAREKETITNEGVPIRLSADFSKETLQARRGWKEVFKVMKGKDLHPRLLLSNKVVILNGRADEVLLRKGQVKGVHHHQALII